MAPARRYLRISSCTVLECHIYTEPPALQHTWLLNPRNPILPKVIEHIKPAVIPRILKAREDDLWNKKKKPMTKKPEILSTDEFEVSITLLPTDDRHSILQKHKHLSNRATYKVQNSGKGLIAASASASAPIDADALPSSPITIPEEEEEEEDTDEVIFTAPEAPVDVERGATKRARGETAGETDEEEVGSETLGIFVPSDDEGEAGEAGEGGSGGFSGEENAAKRTRQTTLTGEEKKKLKMDVWYEGFAIYGHVLCLVIKKPGGVTKRGGRRGEPGVMEHWLSTQLPAHNDDEG